MVSIPVVVDEPSGGLPAARDLRGVRVSIPVVVDEPSGVEEKQYFTTCVERSQSLLSWMSPRAAHFTATSDTISFESQSLLSWMSPRAFDPPPGHDLHLWVSIPVVVDEPSGARSASGPRASASCLNPCCRG